MDKDEAERHWWSRLADALAADDDDDDETLDLDPEVRCYRGIVTGNEYYRVVFNLKGRSVALTPDDARDFAKALLDAADDADARH
jgi:hypothetical protein